MASTSWHLKASLKRCTTSRVPVVWKFTALKLQTNCWLAEGVLVMLRASRTRSLPMDETFAAGVVLVRGSAAGFAQEIRAGRHRLMADEPVADGGTDTGPGPYDLLLGALGA